MEKPIYILAFVGIDSITEILDEHWDYDEGLPDIRATSLNIANRLQEYLDKQAMKYTEYNFRFIALPGPHTQIGGMRTQVNKDNEAMLANIYQEISLGMSDILGNELTDLVVLEDNNEFTDHEMQWLTFQQYLYQRGVFSCEATSPDTLRAIIDGLSTDVREYAMSGFNGKVVKNE